LFTLFFKAKRDILIEVANKSFYPFIFKLCILAIICEI